MNPLHQTHILLVEEHPHIATALRRAFESAFPGQCLVEVTPVAETALDTLRGGTVDLVVVDSHALDMSGIALIRHARVTSPPTRALLITTLPSPEMERLARRLGAAYLPKPFSFQEFLCVAGGLPTGEKEREDTPGNYPERGKRTEATDCRTCNLRALQKRRAAWTSSFSL